jgi:hypothetical protein
VEKSLEDLGKEGDVKLLEHVKNYSSGELIFQLFSRTTLD